MAALTYRSWNPHTGQLLAERPCMLRDSADAVLAQVAEAQRASAARPLSTRLDAVSRLGAALADHREPLARTMTEELGKPLLQARAEVDKCVRMCGLVVDMAPGALARRYVRLDGVDAWVEPVPIGTILAVMPWNYPLWQALRCIVPQLAAGNGVLLKPAPSVLQSTEALMAVVEAAWPEAAVGLIWTDNDDTVGLIADDRVRGAVCVGGDAAGQAVGRAAGAARKKCVLELGGNDAYVILAGADLEAAVDTCVRSRLKNGGQACLSAKRIIAEDSLYIDVLDKLCERVRATRVGDPRLPETALGPLASRAARARLHAQVRASVAAGAELVLGGTVPDGPGAHYPPTVLAEVPLGCPAFEEELFGPVFALTRARDPDHAFELANRSRFGLGAALFAAESPASLRLADTRLQAGTVALNGPATSDPRLPFGGLGASGHGVELGEEGLLEFTARRVLRAPRTARAPLRLDRMDHHFELPTPVVDALRAGSAADLADYDDDDGERALRAALAEALGLDRPPVLCAGGEDALLKLLMLGRIEDRRVVLLPTPSWPAVSRVAGELGYVVLPVPSLRTEQGHETDVQGLLDALQRTPRAVLVLGTPNNPTGHATPLSAIEQLIAAAPRARVVLDGVYEPLDGPLAPLSAAHNTVVSIGSFSSQLGLPGLRLGWMAGRLPRAFEASLGRNPSALRAARVALAHRERICADIERARAAAAALGRERGRRWRGLHTAAPFVLTAVDADDDTVAAACTKTGLVPGRVRIDGRLHLRWTLGPASVERRIRQALQLLDSSST